MTNVSEQSINEAINTFKAFVKVQEQNDRETRLEAVDNFAKSTGLDLEHFEYLCGELGQVIDSPGGEFGWAIIGWLLGMLTAQYEQEASAKRSND
jgi:hypothetical protein